MKRFLIFFGKVLLAILIGLCGFHLLMTGSPIPLVHLERLKAPVPVKEITANKLVLVDGRRVSVPHVGSLPTNSPVFAAALERGVEISQDGQVFGLLTLNRRCGNDPVCYDRRRINLSEMAIALNPDTIQGLDISPNDKLRLEDLKRRNLIQYNKSSWSTVTCSYLGEVRGILHRASSKT